MPKEIPQLARAGLACLPTPLQELKNLSKILGGPRIFVKRDDMTGLGFGGNKVRKLDYLMPVILESGSDYIVTGASVQSNWCTAVSAAARKFGLKTVLVKKGPAGYDPEEYDGNHLLHHLLGAEIAVVKPGTEEAVRQEIVERLGKEGHKPFLIGVGGNTPHGVAGYVHAMREISQQAGDQGIDVDYVVHTCGSGGTQAGTVIGARTYLPRAKVICSTSGSRSTAQATKLVLEFIANTVKHFGLNAAITADDIRIQDSYAGGYGFAVPAKLEAIKLLAETEGLFLDPVYTSSSMACLIDFCRRDLFRKGEVVVFIHTGGQAGLFPYKAPLKSYLRGAPLPWTAPPWYSAG